MINKLRSVFASRNTGDAYAHLPQPIRDEVNAAMEATSRYDIP